MGGKKLRVLLCALVFVLAPALSWSAVIGFSVDGIDPNANIINEGGDFYITDFSLPIREFTVTGSPVSPFVDLVFLDGPDVVDFTFNYFNGTSSGGNFTLTGTFTDSDNPSLTFTGTVMTGSVGGFGLYTDFDDSFIKTGPDPITFVGGDFPMGIDSKDAVFAALFGLAGGPVWQYMLDFTWDFLEDSSGVYVSSGAIYNETQAVLPVPEPGTLMLLGTGLFGLILCRRRMLYRD